MKKKKLEDHIIEITDKHYIKNKVKYDRVTSILNIIHDFDLEKLRRVKGFWEVDNLCKMASSLGKSFHTAARLIAEGHFNNMLESVYAGNDLYPEIKLTKEWLVENVKKYIFIEKTFYDDVNYYAGTPDLVAEMKNGKIAIIDYKTGSQIKTRHYIQLAAYTKLVEKNTDYKIQERIILHIRDNKIKQIKIKSKKDIDAVIWYYIFYIYKYFGGNHG